MALVRECRDEEWVVSVLHRRVLSPRMSWDDCVLAQDVEVAAAACCWCCQHVSASPPQHKTPVHVFYCFVEIAGKSVHWCWSMPLFSLHIRDNDEPDSDQTSEAFKSNCKFKQKLDDSGNDQISLYGKEIWFQQLPLIHVGETVIASDESPETLHRWQCVTRKAGTANASTKKTCT